MRQIEQKQRKLRCFIGLFEFGIEKTHPVFKDIKNSSVTSSVEMTRLVEICLNVRDV